VNETRTIQRSFETQAAPLVRVRNASGYVRVETHDAPVTEVEFEPLDGGAESVLDEIRVDQRGGEIDAEVPERRGIFGRSPSFGVRIRCPERSRVDVRSRSADVSTRGVLGGVEVKTASGDVEVEEVEGRFGVQSASGDVEAREVRGSAEVQTASGDVQLVRVFGDARVQTVSGDVSVREVEGGVETHTVSGDQTIETVAVGPITANSVSGDVSIGVRRGSNVWLDVRSLSGDTTSSLDHRDAEPPTDAPVVELRANTVSGDVRIGRS